MTAIVFHSGKLIVTGARRVEDLYACAGIVVGELNKLCALVL